LTLDGRGVLGERHQVNRIVVKPGGRLSLQKHHHCCEHRIVSRGAVLSPKSIARARHMRASGGPISLRFIRLASWRSAPRMAAQLTSNIHDEASIAEPTKRLA
jgi:hypothetical protein